LLAILGIWHASRRSETRRQDPLPVKLTHYRSVRAPATVMKPYRGPPMTPGNAAAAMVQLIIWCRVCGRQVEPHAGEMAQHYGPETAVIDWHVFRRGARSRRTPGHRTAQRLRSGLAISTPLPRWANRHLPRAAASLATALRDARGSLLFATWTPTPRQLGSFFGRRSGVIFARRLTPRNRVVWFTHSVMGDVRHDRTYAHLTRRQIAWPV
jgi:hypothetical protein